MEETPYWLGFHLVPGIGATRLARIIEHFGSLAVAWKASLAELRASGLNQRAAEAVLATRGRISLDAELERVRRAGAEIVTLADDAYPRLLREISSPPTVLYVRGSLGEDDAPAVGVVGTRRATSYGREMTRRLCTGLAQAGVTIVSGLARGIDGVAHTTALEGGARTIAVLGCGLDTIYPPEHRGLAERIIAQGALVSEFPLGTRPDAGNFPIRNRLISGLSLGVIVVEAPRKSGALITSNFAAAQGRTVFAVPGSALASTSEGPLQLLRDGAVLATDPDDVLADLNLGTRQVEMEIRRVLPASGDERDVLGLLSAEPRHVDELALELGMHISRLSALLLQMQLKGFIRDAGAHHYVRA